MKQHDFEKKNNPFWQAFTKQLEALESLSKNKRETQENLENFAEDYRRICQHLAIAQERLYGEHLIHELNQLSLRGHQQLYQQSFSLWRNIGRFFAVEFPQTLRQEWRLFLLASLLLFLPMFIMIVAIVQSPDFAYELFSPQEIAQFTDMYDPTNERFGRERSSDSDFMMFGFYILNNIGIDFRCFASGLLFGIGSIFFMVYNGIFIGGVAGVLTQKEYIETFYSFVIGHGSFELTAAAISGAAGLKIGFALLAPGRLRRLDALKVAAKTAIKLLYGAASMTLIAAFIEAYWSSMQIVPASIKYLVGALLWLFVYGYIFFAGRGVTTDGH